MFQALLGPALSFGSSLLSGFGAQQSAKKQQKIQMAYEYQNYLQRQEIATQVLDRYQFANIPLDAESAGFNPVTYLNAMGGSYGAMHQLGWSLRSQGQSAPTVQVPSSLEVFGGAAQAGVSTFLADQRVAQSQDFQRQMLQTQISAIQKNGGKPLRLSSAVPAANTTFFGSGSIPYSVTAGAARVGGGGGGNAPMVSGQSVLVGDEVKNPSPFQRQGWYSNPNWPGAQAVGDAYHEEGPVVYIYGNVVKPYVDTRYNWDIYKHIGVDLPGIRIEPADRNQLGYYPDGARGLSWGRPNGSGAIHPETPKPRNRIGWPGFSIEW